MRRNIGILLAWGVALLALAPLASAVAAGPGFTTRVEPPADPGNAFAVTPTVGGEELAVTTRLAGLQTSFSIDHNSGRDAPRMRWSRPIGASLAGLHFASDGWSFSLNGGYGGDDAGSSALLAPGSARSRTGWSTGLEYDFGPWQLGGYYQFSHSDLGFTPAGQVETSYGLGANYNVAPGLSLFSEAFFYSDGLGRAPLAATQSGAPGNSSLKSQSGKLYVIGTRLEW